MSAAVTYSTPFVDDNALLLTIVNVPGMMFWYLGSADATGWQVSDAMVSKFNLDAVAGGADFSGFFGFYTGVGSWGDGATQFAASV